jgi:hypothetical protein
MRSRLLAYQVVADEPATGVLPPGTKEGQAADRGGRDPASSQLIGLSSRLFLGTDPLKVIAIVSCKPHEGVTYVGHALHNFLAFEMNFSSTLLKAEECLHAFHPEKHHSPATSLLAAEPDPTRFLDAASLQSRVVLIDCPPLCSSAAVLSLAPYVDGVLLVVEDGERSKAEIDRAVNTIKAAQGRVVGIVLNKRRYVLPNWLYRLLNY